MYDARDGSALWRFALAAYARPRVAPLCLELQDRYGANVMVLLHLCHAAATGRVDVDVRAAASAMAPLERHLVAPLRQARRTLASAAKATGSEPLQAAAARILEAELGAERLQCMRVDEPVGLQPDPIEACGIAERWVCAYLMTLPGHAWQRDAAAGLAQAVFAA